MEDSVSDIPQAETPKEPEKPAGPVAIIVASNKKGGGVRELLKGSDGKFVSKNDKNSSSEIKRRFRKIASELVEFSVKDGKVKRMPKIEAAHEYVMWLARGNGSGDPKADMVSVQAYKELTLRMYGKHSTSDEDREAMQLAGIRTIFIPMPEIMHPEIINADAPKETPKPEFIDAEVVVTNPPPEMK